MAYGIEHAIPLTAAIIACGGLIFQIVKQRSNNGFLRKSDHERICQLIQERVQQQIDTTRDDIKEIKDDVREIKCDISIIKERIAKVDFYDKI